MKKLLAALTFVGAMSLGGPVARSSDIVLPSSSVVNTVLAVTKNVDLDLNANRVDSLSVQVVYSSGNPSAITFGDGTPGSGSLRVVNGGLASLTTAYASEKITVASNAAGVKASGTMTIISTTGLSGITVTVNGTGFTEGASWIGIGAGVTKSTAATNLARVINGSSNTISVAASSVSGVVFATATVAGLAGNVIPLATTASGSVMTASATLLRGLETANYHQTVTITAGGSTNVLTEGSDWSQLDVASNTAKSLNTALLNRFSSVFISTVQPGTAIIYSTAVTAGSAANAYTVTASTVALTVNSATFAGGQDNAVIKISNFPLTANTDWTVGTTSITCARSISAAINSKLSSILVSTHTLGIVYATATIVGTQTNYTMSVTTATELVLSGAIMTGGGNANITLSNPPSLLSGLFNYSMILPGSQYGVTNTINATPTGLGIGSELLYTTTAGTAPGGLVAGTTYYASNLTSTSFQVSDTSTGAVAGLSIAITTTTQAGGGSFVLTPLALSGTPTWKLQKSNDGTNFQDIYVSTSALLAPFAASVSFASAYAASNQLWELGDVTYKWLRLAFTKATHGGVNLNYIVNGKRK